MGGVDGGALVRRSRLCACFISARVPGGEGDEEEEA